MQQLFEAILYQPLYNALIGFYNIVPDIGFSIIVLTLIIKFILLPLNRKAIRAQRSLSKLQPKLEELKKKHENDKEAMAQETMKLYREHKVNPFGSCLPILIQLPIFLAFFWVIQNGIGETNADLLYGFVSAPETLNPVTLGLINLAEISIPLAALTAVAQYIQAKMMQSQRPPKNAGEGAKDENMASMVSKQMLVMMPIITFIVGFTLPSGVLLYWFCSTMFTAIHQYFEFRKKDEEPAKA